jgi:hypothetical protein
VFFTACHVVSSLTLMYERNGDTGNVDQFEVHEKQETATVYNHDRSQSYLMYVKTCDKASDLAILVPVLHAPEDTWKTDIAPSTPSQGDSVWGLGYGMGERLYIAQGWWQNVAMWEEEVTKYIVTIPTIYGDSGSPVIQMIRGRVMIVGMRQVVRAAGQIPITHLAGSPGPETIQKHKDSFV